MDDDELYRLNSLHRFSKHSKLVLEAHSHCEVPAGCGGAVLQWLDPEEGAPHRLHEHGSMRLDATYIDGKKVVSSSVRLEPGPHVLALVLEPLDSGKPPWFTVTLDRRERAQRDALVLSTAADGTWRWTTKSVPDNWFTSGFDDNGWGVLSASRITAADLEEWSRRSFEADRARGVVALALPNAHPVRVRCRFTLGALPP